MKRPQHKKNKNPNPADETPIIDERNLVGAEKSAEMSIEDRIAMYWMENKSFVIGCFTFLIAFIVILNGLRIYKNHADEKLQNDYTTAKAEGTLETYAKDNSGKEIGGFAALTVADEAFEAEDYARAIEFYELSAQALKGNILAGRALLGKAFALYQSGNETEAFAQLNSIASNVELSQNIRAEAAYHLAVNAFAAGKDEEFQGYVAQVGGLPQAQQWNQRLQYYVQQSR